MDPGCRVKRKKTKAFEMRCYRRLLNISYKNRVINEEVRSRIQASVGDYDELLTLVKKRKLRWFGHVSRSSGLAKTTLQGTVKRQRKRGRQVWAVWRMAQALKIQERRFLTVMMQQYFLAVPACWTIYNRIDHDLVSQYNSFE